MASHQVARPIWAASLSGRVEGFTVARALLRKWASSRHGGWPAEVDPLRARWQPAQGCRVVTDSWAADGRQVWSITVDRPADDHPWLCWRTSATLTDPADGRMLLQVAHGFEPVESRVLQPPSFDPVRPSFIPGLLNQVPMFDAGQVLTPRAVSGAGLDSYLSDPARRLPILVAGDGVDVGKLADMVAGAGVVVPVAGLESRWWRAAGGRLPAAGLVAVHWAGLPVRAQTVEANRFLCVERAAARRVFVGSQFAIAEDAATVRLRSLSLKARWQPAALPAATVSVEPIVEPAPAPSSDEFGEMLAAWDADLARLDVAEGELRAMSSDMAVLRSRLAAFETVNRPGRDGGPADFGSPAAAVRLAGDQFAGQLDMHPRVWAGLHRFEYPEPTHLYLDLVRLAGMVARWQAGDGPLERLAGEAGLPGWSPAVSPTALAQYPSDYVLSWDGVEVVFGAHFGRGARTAANCYRAYIWLDEGRRRAVVGWVGPHLRDTTNN